MKVSVIIPILNECDSLPENLATLKGHTWIHEVILVDGGSKDGTLAWLQRQSGVTVVDASRGRGTQLNAGACAATGDSLLFLHADSRLPPDAGRCLRETLKSPQVVGGCFSVRFACDSQRALRIVAAGINFRTIATRSATGDQAIFVRRSVFEEIGGFPGWSLFEDVELVSRIKRAGKFAVIRSQVTVSARRHVHNGVFRTVMLVYLLRLGFWAGVSPFTLASWYEAPSEQQRPRRAMRAVTKRNMISG